MRLHSCDSGITLRELIYERINFCAIIICGTFFFQFTPPSRKHKFRKVLLFVMIRNSPKYSMIAIHETKFWKIF